MRIEGNILYVGKKTYRIDNMPDETKVKFGLIKKKEKPEKKVKRELKEGEEGV